MHVSWKHKNLSFDDFLSLPQNNFTSSVRFSKNGNVFLIDEALENLTQTLKVPTILRQKFLQLFYSSQSL